MEFINVTEVFAKERLNEILSNDPGCKCERCYLDALSITCNTLKTRYVNTSTGEVFKKVEMMRRQQKIDVDIAVHNAIKLVRENPRHTEEERKHQLVNGKFE